MVERLLREPLFHFAALAALVFAAYQAVGAGEAGRERVIRLSGAEVARLATIYKAEAGMSPDAEELRRILGDHVETLALAAEARRLGLDEGDAVVERRLAQKMRFTLDDRGAIAPPDEKTLRQWIAANSHRFRLAARYSFDQIFFQKPGEAQLRTARAALAQGEDWRRLGDPFIMGRQAGDLPLREIARRFGEGFANALAPLEQGPEWQGPLPSAFGAHLVRITAKQGGSMPSFEEIRAPAQAAWIEEARRARAAEAVAELVARYEVVIEKEALRGAPR